MPLFHNIFESLQIQGLGIQQTEKDTDTVIPYRILLKFSWIKVCQSIYNQ